MPWGSFLGLADPLRPASRLSRREKCRRRCRRGRGRSAVGCRRMLLSRTAASSAALRSWSGQGCCGRPCALDECVLRECSQGSFADREPSGARWAACGRQGRSEAPAIVVVAVEHVRQRAGRAIDRAFLFFGIRLLHAGGDYRVLRSLLELRGAWLPDEDQGRVCDVAQLFWRRDMSRRICVSRRPVRGSQPEAVVAEPSVQAGHGPDGGLPARYDGDDVAGGSPTRLVWACVEGNGEFRAALTADGMLPVRQSARHGWGSDDDASRVELVGTGGLNPGDISDIFDDVVLTDAEDGAVEAMRLIDRRVERIAVLASRRPPLGGSARCGILVRMRGGEGRVPIGSGATARGSPCGSCPATATAASRKNSPCCGARPRIRR